MKPNKSNIEVSILISSKNKFAIQNIVDNFKDNKTRYEIIIAGPFSSYNENNLKIINSYNKPPQCHLEAFRLSKGKFVSFLPDDLFFSQKNFLDKWVKLAKKNQKKLVSLKLLNKLNYDLNSYKFHPEIKESPYLPISPLLKRDLLRKIKIFDKRFNATLYDLDLYLRLLKKGYKVLFSKIQVKEKNYSSYSLNQDYISQDRKLLNKLWTEKDLNGTTSIFGDKIFLMMRKKRADKVQGYNFSKLNKPQGNLGRWKINNKLYFFISNKIYYFIFKKILKLPVIESKLYLFYRSFIKTKFQK